MALEVTHNDIYLQLGELKGMMQALTQANSNFVESFRVLSTRIDKLEARQSTIETTQNTQKGGLAVTSWLIPLVLSTTIGVFGIWVSYQALMSQATPSTEHRTYKK